MIIIKSSTYSVETSSQKLTTRIMFTIDEIIFFLLDLVFTDKIKTP